MRITTPFSTVSDSTRPSGSRKRTVVPAGSATQPDVERPIPAPGQPDRVSGVVVGVGTPPTVRPPSPPVTTTFTAPPRSCPVRASDQRASTVARSPTHLSRTISMLSDTALESRTRQVATAARAASSMIGEQMPDWATHIGDDPDCRPTSAHCSGICRGWVHQRPLTISIRPGRGQIVASIWRRDGYL
jgi:hypothetical protein